eukprot:Phypoly_transcript_06651.p1 GENE.Phypoly_transcript_06651~~Phypoly_transcript_06651.p1  ORF type:complete len:381 (+),score=69.76 Phypoly_transcript_06651:555-1697(+)
MLYYGTRHAIHLKKNGFSPVVFEKVSEYKDVGGPILLAPNGFRALEKVGLAKKLIETTVPIEKILNLKHDGTQLCSSDLSYVQERYHQPVAGVKRATIQQFLLAELNELGIPIHFGKQLTEIEDSPTDEYVSGIFSDGTRFQGSFLVGSDGLHSATRACLFGKEAPLYSGIAPVSGISLRPAGYEQAFYNIFGVDSFLATYPFSKTHVMWSAAVREPESPEVWRNFGLAEFELFKETSHYLKWAEPVPTLIKTAERVYRAGLYDRPPLPHWFKGRCVLIGDAAHPTTPHLAQGANQALVDCMILTKHILAHPTDLQRAFSEFETERLPRTTPLVKGARERGERRCAPAELCAQRDEWARNMYDDRENVVAETDLLYNESY